MLACIAVANMVNNYYYSAILVALLTRWSHIQLKLNLQQLQTRFILLKECLLLNKSIRFKVCSIHNESTKTLIQNWDKFKHQVAPGTSPLSSFLYHLAFQTAVSMCDFSPWQNANWDTFPSLYNKRNNQLFSCEYLKSQMNCQYIHRFQNTQVQGLIIYKRTRKISRSISLK